MSILSQQIMMRAVPYVLESDFKFDVFFKFFEEIEVNEDDDEDTKSKTLNFQRTIEDDKFDHFCKKPLRVEILQSSQEVSENLQSLIT